MVDQKLHMVPGCSIVQLDLECNSKSLNIVCKLGGFYTMMSFIGSIGLMMKGSGLEEALETVYGANAVSHMISGKDLPAAPETLLKFVCCKC